MVKGELKRGKINFLSKRNMLGALNSDGSPNTECAVETQGAVLLALLKKMVLFEAQNGLSGKRKTYGMNF